MIYSVIKEMSNIFDDISYLQILNSHNPNAGEMFFLFFFF